MSICLDTILALEGQRQTDGWSELVQYNNEKSLRDANTARQKFSPHRSPPSQGCRTTKI